MARHYGSGSVFRRKRDHRIVAQWELPPEDGKRRRRQVTADTEAEAWRKMRKAQAREGRSSSRSRRQTESVGSFLDRWLDDVVRPTRREKTLVGYRAIVDVAKRDLGMLDLTSITEHDVQRFVNRLDRSPVTVRHYVACLRGAFAYAVRRRIIDRNPADDIDLPRATRVERRPLPEPELERLLEATAGDELHALWVAAAWTGMRQGELLGLRWEDVDLPHETLTVRRSLTRLPGEKGVRYVLTEPKNRTSARPVPLDERVVEALTELRKRQLSAPGKLDQGLVFCTAAGSPLDASAVSRAFGQAVAAAGVPRIRFHDLRHGFVSMLIDRGVDLKTIADLVGHSTITTTVDQYGHINQAQKRAAIAKLRRVG